MKVKRKKVKPFLHKLCLKSEDNLSKFNAYVDITVKDEEFLCWFVKVFKIKVKLGQAGANLIYMSINIKWNGKIKGKWFYANF